MISNNSPEQFRKRLTVAVQNKLKETHTQTVNELQDVSYEEIF